MDSHHRRFLSSLKHMQNRLASEHTPGCNVRDSQNPSQLSLLSSPLLLANDRPTSPSSSQPPPEFLSHPLEGEKHTDDVDDIQRLVGLLGLSLEEMGGEGESGGECCCSGGGFYRTIAGVKGPKCEKEKKRLDGWIRYYASDGAEPARLAYLLLAKAVSFGGTGEMGFGDMEFLDVVTEHLEHDPPSCFHSPPE